MAIEYQLRFHDPEWYSSNREVIAARLLALPTFVARVAPEEIWLKGLNSTHVWSYDLRVFLKPNCLQVEVSMHSDTTFSDFSAIARWIREQTVAEFVDDDGLAVDIFSQ